MKKRILWSMVAMVTASVAYADAYRWVDKDGNVVFSQSPPADEQTSERVELPATKPLSDDETTTSEDEETEESEYTDDGERPASVDDLDPAVRQDYCDRAKQNVELLENTEPGTSFITEDKTVVKFSEEERAQRLQQAKEAMEAYCYQ